MSAPLPCVWCGEVPTLRDGAWRCEDSTCPRWASLMVYTARIGAAGLDITRKSASGTGLLLAPSWSILTPALEARHSGDPAREEAAWEAYVPAYLAEMRQSYRAHRTSWRALFARGEVTLLCYCADPARCHRTILARDILPKLGAVYMGERPAPQPSLFGGPQ